MSSYVSKYTAERNQRILLDLASKPGNDVCADCRARAPRWASHNLGIFICMNCASIHRKIGTHVTKVKSVTMDSWSKEQIEVMKSIGNVASNAKYNPDEARHPLPANLEESERDSELEKFIRGKYEFKRFVDSKPRDVASSSKRKVPTLAPPAPHVRPQSTPAASMARRSSPLPPVPTTSPSHPVMLSRPAETPSMPTASPVAPPQQTSTLPGVPASIASRAAPAPTTVPASFPVSVPAPAPMPAPRLELNPVSKHPVWDDMVLLANPGQPGLSTTHQPQVQLQAPTHFEPQLYASPGSSVTNNTYGAALTTNNGSLPSTMASNQILGRSVSLPVFQSTSGPFPTQHTQPQLNVGNSFPPQPLAGFAGQMTLNGTPFQPSASVPAQVQSPFGQLQSSPLSHSYTLSAFPQQQQQQQQQFTPSSLPQQYGHPSNMAMQQPLQVFPQQPLMQGGGNPYGTPMWQQQHSGQPPPHGAWGGM